jgi:hypothetical protein
VNPVPAKLLNLARPATQTERNFTTEITEATEVFSVFSVLSVVNLLRDGRLILIDDYGHRPHFRK